MKTINIGKYEVYLKDDGNIICNCKFGSIYPSNYLKGDKLCRHIKEYIKSNLSGAEE